MFNPQEGTYLAVAVDLSSTDAEYNANNTLRGVLLMSDGTLKITDVEGTVITLTIPAVADGGNFPTHIPIQIKKIWKTGTSITDTDIIGLR